VGTPEITSIAGLSPTSVALKWRPPPLASIQGEFLGYKISFWPVNETSTTARHVHIKNANATVSIYIVA
jgi:hypothetical protein